LVVDADEAPSAVTTDLAGILPAIIDRGRVGTEPFVVAITMADASDVLRRLELPFAVLSDAPRSLEFHHGM
jgi:predicted fused transcriptional regulator/phosphomethylpyrimidine kinase